METTKLNSIESNMKNNDILIESLKNIMKNTIGEEKVQVLLNTIENLKYQNEINEANYNKSSIFGGK